jgi:hypothetical protein
MIAERCIGEAGPRKEGSILRGKREVKEYSLREGWVEG